ncbi:MAG: hypothetical protein NTV43_02465 [Methylococcales bacterium]|nr:hypothetical protein [Methylococcales bacterium]
MRWQQGGDATRVLQNARHTLFVEGKDNQEIDAVVIQELLNANGLTAIDVQTMGSCDNVRSAAQALIAAHPSYYFLIDRDDQDQASVDSSWIKFPDPSAYNMLIWRKRELENYFIDPAYLSQSQFLKPNVDVKQRILDECNRRLFLDSANLTLYALSRELRKPLAIRHFANPDLFQNEDDGLLQLGQLSQFANKTSEVAAILNGARINGIYLDFVQELSGGVFPLQYGSGTWLERMSGKEVFHAIASQCFLVKDASGTVLTGKAQNKQIAKQLARLPLAQQPVDFQELVALLKTRLN